MDADFRAGKSSCHSCHSWLLLQFLGELFSAKVFLNLGVLPL